MTKITCLGDSIRMQYTPVVKKLLGEEFEVFAPAENCRYSKFTLRGLFDWEKDMAGSRIVHWNNGLWDFCNLFGDGAFAECPLRSVSLGSGIEKIESFALMNHGNYGFYPLTVTYNGTLAQWKSVERGGRWIQEADCSFSCLDFSGSIMDVYE